MLKTLQYSSLYISFLLLFYSCENKKDTPNVLFIAVDDLRYQPGYFENKVLKTPHLNKLVSEGILFTNHYVQVPTCGASRHSLLTAQRPKTKAHLGNNITDKELSNRSETIIPETFIHQFKNKGYHTVGIGKISHSADGLVYKYTETPSKKRELPYSWNELIFDSGKWKTGWNAFFGYADGTNRQSKKRQAKPYEAANVSNTGYPDGLTAQLAISKLRELKKNKKPFFMGVGFFKPHLPFTAPQKYWNLYNRDSIKIAPNPTIPSNVHKISIGTSSELNQYKLTDEIADLDKPVSKKYARKLRHAYYASVSYVDEQIGKVLEELQTLHLDKNTIIVVWGDHGWHLGDQQRWGKHTLFDTALRSALIFKIPGSDNSSKRVTTIVETVDIFPTIAKICNIEIAHNVDGESFLNTLKDPSKQKTEVAYSYFNKGISVRTNRYRLTKYYRKQEPTIELYDHLHDPNESINIAKANKKIVSELMELIKKGDTGLYDSPLP